MKRAKFTSPVTVQHKGVTHHFAPGTREIPKPLQGGHFYLDALVLSGEVTPLPDTEAEPSPAAKTGK